MIKCIKLTGILFLCCFLSVKAQNKKILFGFEEIPQSMLVNPGFQQSNKGYVGIPLLSGNSFSAGMSEVTVADLFRNDNIDFNTKVRNALNRLSDSDYVSFNTQIEILSGGYKLNKRDYITAGFYMELDFFANYLTDFIDLINDGSATNLNRSFLVSQANIKAEALSVLHFGLSRKVNDKLTAGARFKIYSGVANITSSSNTGSFTTRLGQNNIYTHTLSNLNFNAYTSGVIFEDDIESGDIIGKALFNNLGVGFDVGFTYQLDKQTTISASLLDIGFVSYSKDNRNYSAQGNYTFSGLELQFDSTNTDYWQNLLDDLEAEVPTEENQESYSVMRPIKFHSAYKYSWGKSRKEENCSDMSYNDFYNNSVGAQLFSVFRPTGPKFALTGFYQRKLFKNLNTKFTYTIDDFSSSNIGFGLSGKIGKFQLYGLLDNVFGFADIAATNTASFQLGMNLIFN